MRIGIDAKWFFSGNPSGKVVVSNLLKHFLPISKEHEVFVFLKRKERKLSIPFDYPHVKYVYVWGQNNQFSNVFVVPWLIRKHKIDVMLFFYFSPLTTTAKRIVFVFDAIFKSHPEYFTWKERIYFSPMRCLASKANVIITISKTERERLLKYQFGKRKDIDVVYMGVDERYRSSQQYSEDEKRSVREKYRLPERFLLYVGRLNLRKNIQNLLRSLTYLNDKSMKLLLCGKQDGLAYDLHALVKRLNIEDRVIFLGFVDNHDLPILYSLAHVFCYLSFDEGFSLPPVESLASGVPVVVAETGVSAEVCGDAGVYCNPDDPADIAKKIDLLLSDSKLYESKKHLGIEISKQYDWAKSANALLDIFNREGRKAHKKKLKEE